MGESLEDLPVQEVIKGENSYLGAFGYLTAVEKRTDKLFLALVLELLKHHGPWLKMRPFIALLEPTSLVIHHVITGLFQDPAFHVFGVWVDA